MKWFRGAIWACMLITGGVWNTIKAQATPNGSNASAVGSMDTLVVSPAEWLMLQLTNGNWFYGEVIEKTDATIVLNTDILGKVTIQKLDIKRSISGPLTAAERQEIEDNERAKDQLIGLNNLWPRAAYEPDPNATRYFFAPSAFQLKQGEAYYQNSYGLYNQASTGVSNEFTIGTNILAPFAVGFTAKFGVELNSKVHISGGGLVAFPFWDLDDSFGLGFANLTLGSENSNVTFTLGTDFQNSSILNLSALLPLNDQTWLITENYRITSQWYWGDNTYTNYYGIVSLGLRRFAQRRGFTWDYALVLLTDEEMVFPFYSLTIPIKPKSER
ncbi:MAG: hypothetical protein O2818_07130 [Bacteroidetes bacterium]|nr:hypothetical protein [Bacteroidota bacterium]MDA1336644.1 hypothetical protein [Bacteroidota bacterium]